jgi:hypothetical protein
MGEILRTVFAAAAGSERGEFSIVLHLIPECDRSS